MLEHQGIAGTEGRAGKRGSHLGTAENPTPNGQPQGCDKDAPPGRMARSLTQREDWTRDIGDTDCTDFRGVQSSYGHRVAGCVFCALEGSGRVLLENELALCIAEAYPLSKGHSLMIPRRHGADGLELHQPQWNAVVELMN